MTLFRDMVKEMDMGCRVRQGREVTACIRSAGRLGPTYQAGTESLTADIKERNINLTNIKIAYNDCTARGNGRP